MNDCNLCKHSKNSKCYRWGYRMPVKNKRHRCKYFKGRKEDGKKKSVVFQRGWDGKRLSEKWKN